MSDQTLPIPTGGDPMAPRVEVTPPGGLKPVEVKMWTYDTGGNMIEVTGEQAAPVEEPAQPPGTPLDHVPTLIWHIDRTVTLAGILSEYIDKNFKPGVDFGPAHAASEKNTLLKPGGEKLITVLGLRVRFVPDRASLAMAGNPAGLFAYKCLLINWHGETVGEGRGACSTGERKNMTINNAIKMAEKRAQGDAICRVACVSEHFTSDDDIPNEERGEQRQEQRQERRPVEQRQEQRQASDNSTQTRGEQPPATAVGAETFKRGVWSYYKHYRQAQNLATDTESLIGDINDLLRSYRMGATVNTATPAEWARAYNDTRKAANKAASAPAEVEEIFN